jgi:hypothetical protein
MYFVFSISCKISENQGETITFSVPKAAGALGLLKWYENRFAAVKVIP